MKKKLILMFIFASFCTAVKGQLGYDRGIKFNQTTLSALIEQAEKDGRYIFADIYAPWCETCEYMHNRVFPRNIMGDYFNSTFVNGKFDAETVEGSRVAIAYDVQKYPTYLIIDSDGNEVGRMIGGDDAEAFIAAIKRLMSNVNRDSK